tara:strand:+ start:5341 stop:6099 length:759 start_codon:yes stop_codon:yes gene_type:complete
MNKSTEKKPTYFYDRYNFHFKSKSREKLYLGKDHPFTEFLRLVQKQFKVLDVGCGGGFLTNLINKKTGCTITGLDLSEKSLETARVMCKNATFTKGDALHLPFANDSFDALVSNGVIHHTPNPFKGFSEAIRVIKKKGIIYMSVYNKAHIYSFLYATYGRFLRLFNPNKFWIQKIFHPLYRLKFKMYCSLFVGEWDSSINTFNLFADAYLTPIAHFHTPKQMIEFGKKNGLEVLRAQSGNNGKMIIFIFRKK